LFVFVNCVIRPSPWSTSSIQMPEYSKYIGCVIICIVMIATSRAVVTCPSAGRPVQLTNVVPAMLSSFARSFMRATHSACEPYSASATATAASFALPTIMLLSNSSNGCTSPTSSSTCEPPMPAASCDTVISSSSATRPASMASSASSIVITFTTDATVRGASALCSKMTCPL